MSVSEFVDYSQRELVARDRLTLIETGQSHISSGALRAKRLLDVTVAVVGIFVAMPIAVLIAAIVKLSSPGPVLFRQQRVGQGGRLFVMLKFRTMRVGTYDQVLDDPEELRLYMANDFKLPPDDPRITAIGRVLRKTSLDELPQLVNVLIGHMSLVGIRPLVAAELELRPPADRMTYMTLRPGVTGLWQIKGRSTMNPADRVTLESRYVEEWSMMGDLSILLRTPLAVLNLRHTH